MTKLEWCRENAPTLWKNLTDEELLARMDSMYKDTVGASSNNTNVEIESVEYAPNKINEYLDYMVLELVREFGNKLAFKGGYMLTKLMRNTARQTTDIDFSILSDDIYEQIKIKLWSICNHLQSTGVIDKYVIKDNIAHFMSGGADMYKNGRKVLGVDVGWHDISYGTVIRSIDVCDVNSFKVERMLADKITAILSRKRFRRPKDLYDLYCISECMEFDAKIVQEYILKRTDGKGADWQNYPFNEKVLIEYEKAYNSLQLESIYSNVILERPTFDTVIGRFDVIAVRVKTVESSLMWSVNTKCFNMHGGV